MKALATAVQVDPGFAKLTPRLLSALKRKKCQTGFKRCFQLQPAPLHLASMASATLRSSCTMLSSVRSDSTSVAPMSPPCAPALVAYPDVEEKKEEAEEEEEEEGARRSRWGTERGGGGGGGGAMEHVGLGCRAEVVVAFRTFLNEAPATPPPCIRPRLSRVAITREAMLGGVRGGRGVMGGGGGCRVLRGGGGAAKSGGREARASFPRRPTLMTQHLL